MPAATACYPHNARACRPKDKQRRECREALNETEARYGPVTRTNDEYLRIMVDVARLIVRPECAGR